MAGVDLVENADFRVQGGVCRERILFEIRDLLLDGRGICPDVADGGQRGNVGAVSKLERSVDRLEVLSVDWVDRAQVSLAVGEERDCCSLVRRADAPRPGSVFGAGPTGG